MSESPRRCPFFWLVLGALGDSFSFWPFLFGPLGNYVLLFDWVLEGKSQFCLVTSPDL